MALKLDPKQSKAPGPFAPGKDVEEKLKKKRSDDGANKAQGAQVAESPLLAAAKSGGGTTSSKETAAAAAEVLSHFSEGPAKGAAPKPPGPRLERPYAVPKPNKNAKKRGGGDEGDDENAQEKEATAEADKKQQEVS